MKYNKISHEQREHVIQELTQNGKTLKEVSEDTNLKPSTVKAILQVYLKEGRIGKKCTRDRKVKILNTNVLAVMDPSKNSIADIQGLQFLTSFVKVNQQSSDISHNGQTLAETQQKLDEFSKIIVSQQVKDMLRERKNDIYNMLKSSAAKSNFLAQLSNLEVADELVTKQIKHEQLTLDEEQVVDKITKKLQSQVKF